MERHTTSYVQLVKPGITLSNTMTAVAGYLFAAGPERFKLTSFLALATGVAFVIASACVMNNIIDKNIDAKMNRTRYREIVVGKIPVHSAYVFGGFLGVCGLVMLLLGTNYLTTVLGIVAFCWYVVVYGYAKRTTPFSTIIGAVCGALPPVAGYTAVTNQIDIASLILFGLLLVWQLPHFYAITIFRRSDYKQAGIPVWPLRYGTSATKANIMFWIVVFLLIVPLLTIYGSASLLYTIICVSVAIFWVLDSALSYKRFNEIAWSKRTFGVSLIVLLALSAAVGLSRFVA